MDTDLNGDPLTSHIIHGEQHGCCGILFKSGLDKNYRVQVLFLGTNEFKYDRPDFYAKETSRFGRALTTTRTVNVSEYAIKFSRHM